MHKPKEITKEVVKVPKIVEKKVYIDYKPKEPTLFGFIWTFIKYIYYYRFKEVLAYCYGFMESNLEIKTILKKYSRFK